jgi:hypothetical protein
MLNSSSSILFTGNKMRDKRFKAECRGGSLKKEQHRQLIKWAYSCVEHVLPLLSEKLDGRLENAILVAKEWEKGTITVKDARKVSVEAHTLARESTNVILKMIARASGHAVATAHMADHSIKTALYSLKAVKNSGKSIDLERRWQNEQLPSEIKELVLNTIGKKDQSLKL